MIDSTGSPTHQPAVDNSFQSNLSQNTEQIFGCEIDLRRGERGRGIHSPPSHPIPQFENSMTSTSNRVNCLLLGFKRARIAVFQLFKCDSIQGCVFASDNRDAGVKSLKVSRKLIQSDSLLVKIQTYVHTFKFKLLCFDLNQIYNHKKNPKQLIPQKLIRLY